jgi:hypothetical protein
MPTIPAEMKRRASGWRGGLLLVLGVVLGATVLQPAVAHVSDSLRHLTREHLDPRYLNTGEAAGGDLSGPHGNLQIRPNRVTGAEVDEGSLGEVPSADQAWEAGFAQNAGNAATATNAANVDGSSIITFNFNKNGESPTPLTTLFTVGGLGLSASCLAGTSATLRVRARTDTNDSYFRTSVGTSDADFDTAENNFIVFDANTSDQNGTMVYRQGSSSGLNAGVVVVTFGYETNPSTGNDCQLAGAAVGH